MPLCPKAHKAPRTLLRLSSCERPTSTKRVRDCIGLQKASRWGRESVPNTSRPREQDALLIRDGECNRQSEQESYFCACAGGMGESG